MADDNLLKMLDARLAAPAAAPAPAPAPEPAADPIMQGLDALLAERSAPAGPSLGERALMGATDPLYGGAQAMAHAFPGFAESGLVRRMGDMLGMGEPNTPAMMDAKVRQREAEYQAQRQAGGQTGPDWARMGGGVAATVPLALATPAGGGLLGSVLGGAATGAAAGALSPVTESEDFGRAKLGQVLAGGATGAVTGPIAHMIGRAIAPKPSEAVRTLNRAGVDMTPGQVMGGAAQRMEDAATSIPLAGDMIARAQRRSLESFNRATANRVLEPLGETVDRAAPVGRELVAAVESRIGRAYDQALAKARPFGPDQQFATDVAAAGQRFLTPQARQTFIATMRDRVVSRLGQGPIDGATFKAVDSELGAMARPYMSAASPSEREIGQAVMAVRDVLRDLMGRQNPQAAAPLRAADAAFARFVRMQGAAGMQGATEGVFSPAQLSAAVRSADRTVRHGAFARGDALMQELSDAGKAVLPSKVPDSGTARRLLTSGGILGGAGYYSGHPWITAGAAGLTAAGTAAAYSPWARMAARGLLAREVSRREGLLGDLVARSGGVAAAPLGALLLSPPEQMLPARPDHRR